MRRSHPHPRLVDEFQRYDVNKTLALWAAEDPLYGYPRTGKSVHRLS